MKLCIVSYAIAAIKERPIEFANEMLYLGRERRGLESETTVSDSLEADRKILISKYCMPRHLVVQTAQPYEACAALEFHCADET